MRTMARVRRNLIVTVLAPLLLSAFAAFAQNTPSSTNAAPVAALAPVPAALGVPKPGPTNDAPYAPQPIVQGGIVITLFPPDSPYLNTNRIREAEVYSMSRSAPGRINSIVNIHNPSIEVHSVDRGLNTASGGILAAGGGDSTPNRLAANAGLLAPCP